MNDVTMTMPLQPSKNDIKKTHTKKSEEKKRNNTLLFSAEFSLVEEQGLENRKLRKLFGQRKKKKKDE